MGKKGFKKGLEEPSLATAVGAVVNLKYSWMLCF